MKDRSVLAYWISLVVLLIGCYMYMKTQDIILRNAFVGAAYALWGVCGYCVLKEARQ